MKSSTFLIAVAILLASCAHVYYAPNTANAPLLSEKGETRINGLVAEGATSEFSGGELQLARAITNSFGVMVNGMTASRTDEVTDWSLWYPTGSHTEKGTGSYLEFGGGYFKTLDERKRLLFETYGGIGFGSVNNDYGYSDHSKVNVTKLFVQPSFGYKSNYFEVAFVPKFSFVDWTVKESQISGTGNKYVNDDLNVVKQNPHFLTFEPALLLRAGGRNVKFQTSLSISSIRSNQAYQMTNLVEDANLSFGISVNIKPKKR